VFATVPAGKNTAVRCDTGAPLTVSVTFGLNARTDELPGPIVIEVGFAAGRNKNTL
jgi:hypothetical protein